MRMFLVLILFSSVALCQCKHNVVTATRIGLVGNTTASGHVIKEKDVFVALPCRSALGRTIFVLYKDTVIICKVKDVGPWFIDDPYWETHRKPRAEIMRGRKTARGKKLLTINGSGIDLSDGAWDKLGIKRGKGKVVVTWGFINVQRTN